MFLFHISPLSFCILLLARSSNSFANSDASASAAPAGYLTPNPALGAIICHTLPRVLRPPQIDCLNALLSLPQSVQEFSLTRQALPVLTSGNCRITVTLAPDRQTEITSSVFINLSASQMIIGCSNEVKRTAGTVISGKTGGLEITAAFHPASGGENGTVGAE